jgi:hypothetical protein
VSPCGLWNKQPPGLERQQRARWRKGATQQGRTK